MPSDLTVRIGDVEREQVVADLGEHLSRGRLTMAEFENRLDTAYSASTRGELAVVLADLPAAAAPLPAPTRASRLGLSQWAPWALTGAICLLIWLVTSMAVGRPLNFWPVWVIGPWGAVLVGRTVFGLTTCRP